MKLNFLFIFLLSVDMLFGQSVKPLKTNFRPDLTSFVTLNDVAYFAADNSTQGTELWRSDGTEAGTYQVSDIVKGTRFDSSFPINFEQIGNKFYFIANSDLNRTKRVFLSDGTGSGTKVFDKCYSPINLQRHGDKLFFIANESNSKRYAYSINSEGEFKKYPFEAKTTSSFIVSENSIYLIQREGIYKFDSSSNEFVLHVDYNQYYSGFVPESFFITPNFVFLFDIVKVSNRNFQRLVVHDRATRSFTVLQDFLAKVSFNSGEILPISGVTSNDLLVFIGDDGALGSEPWYSDGSKEGTKIISDFKEGGGSSGGGLFGYTFSFVNLKGHVLFSAFSDINKGRILYDFNTLLRTFEIFKDNRGRLVKEASIREENGENHVIRLVSYKRPLTGVPEKDDETLDYPTILLKEGNGNFNFKEIDFFVLPSDRVQADSENFQFVSGGYILGFRYEYYTCQAAMIYNFDIADGKFSVKHFFPRADIDSREVQEGYMYIRNFIPLKNKVLIEFYDKSDVLFYANDCDLKSRLAQDSPISYCGSQSVKIDQSSDLNLVAQTNWVFEPQGKTCSTLGTNTSQDISNGQDGELYLTQKSKSGCYSADFISIDYLEKYFSASITGENGICKGEAASLTANISAEVVKPYTVKWLRDGVPLPEKNILLSINEPGTYQVEVTDSIGCSEKSGSFRVNDLSPSNTIISGEKLLKVDQQTVLSVNLLSGQSYQWYKDDAILSSETTNKITVAEPGNYKVEISNATCSVFSEVFTVDIITANEKLTVLSVDIYPNPTSSTLIFNFQDTASEHEIDLLDSGGKIVKKYLLRESNEIDISTLPAGTYLVSYRSQSQIITKRLVKY